MSRLPMVHPLPPIPQTYYNEDRDRGPPVGGGGGGGGVGGGGGGGNWEGGRRKGRGRGRSNRDRDRGGGGRRERRSLSPDRDRDTRDRYRGRGPPDRGLPPPSSSDLDFNEDDLHRRRENMLIEERINRERPCRTLFIRNIKYETNTRDVREKFERFGEIKTFFDLIANRGMVFVTYYDLRAAMLAKEKMQDTDISGRAGESAPKRTIDVHYSLPREDEQQKRCDREKNQGTLFFHATETKFPFTDADVHKKFVAFGDIKNIFPHKDRPKERFIEFWDSRACLRAYDELIGTSWMGGTIDLKFAWDLGQGPHAAPIPRRDDREREMRLNREGKPRDNFRDRGDDRDYRLEYERYGGYNKDRGGYYAENSNSGGYNAQTLPPPPVSVDDRLEQAQKVQQLLSALTGNQPQPPAIPSYNLGNAGAPISSYPLTNPLGGYRPPPPVPTQPQPPVSTIPPAVQALLQSVGAQQTQNPPPQPQPQQLLPQFNLNQLQNLARPPQQQPPQPASTPAAPALDQSNPQIQNLLALLAANQQQQRR